ncbi:glucosaminidase domain-containing protein [Candidatus Roizmanbacteria bacterium]|nr:glucosaminidase domain-containing protein [Candidatus Roizmanbacteria bacterium]
MIKKLLVVLFLLFKVSTVFASENIAGDSAKMGVLTRGPLAQKVSYKAFVLEENRKRKAIEEVLSRSGSPMMYAVDAFLANCKIYRFDCYFLPAISGLESQFGNYVYPGSYNPFGWNGGYAIFRSWEDAIARVAEGIQTRYIQAGLSTIEEIGSRYAESPTWAARVRGYMGTLEAEESKNQLYFDDSALQL